MKLDPQLVGLWDACHLWLQWESAGEAVLYRVQYRLREGSKKEWGPWQDVGGRLTRAWFKWATWRGGWQAQARVAISYSQLGEAAIPDAGCWQAAREVTFTHSACLFEIAAGRQAVHYPKGTPFSAIIDGAGCTYLLAEEIEVEAGETAQVEMTAEGATGWNQLDHPDHFLIRPAYGRVIRNLEPSRSDTAPTGRDFTEIGVLARTHPVTVAFAKRNA